jgi:hypothetical protein
VAAAGGTEVLILSGPPGAGKRFDRSVHLRADELFGFIRSGYVDPWRPESGDQNEVVARAIAAVADAYASGGYLTIVDGIVIPGFSFESIRDSLRAAGHAVSYAVLRAPLATCIERARDRDDHPFGDPEVIERLWRAFADLGELERNAIELGEEAPESAADLLERRLAGGLLAV